MIPVERVHMPGQYERLVFLFAYCFRADPHFHSIIVYITGNRNWLCDFNVSNQCHHLNIRAGLYIIFYYVGNIVFDISGISTKVSYDKMWRSRFCYNKGMCPSDIFQERFLTEVFSQ